MYELDVYICTLGSLWICVHSRDREGRTGVNNDMQTDICSLILRKACFTRPTENGEKEQVGITVRNCGGGSFICANLVILNPVGQLKVKRTASWRCKTPIKTTGLTYINWHGLCTLSSKQRLSMHNHALPRGRSRARFPARAY